MGMKGLHRDGLPARLLAFFEANPKEELTIEQVAIKFDASRQAVTFALQRLVNARVLENVRVVRRRERGFAHDSMPTPLL